MDCSIAGCLGVALDVDHFIASGSFSLDSASKLHQRPLGHCCEAILILCVFCFVVSKSSYYTSLLGCSLFAHQLRDSTRRGLWFWVVGSTPHLSRTGFMIVYTATILVTWFSIFGADLVRFAPTNSHFSRLSGAFDV